MYSLREVFSKCRTQNHETSEVELPICVKFYAAAAAADDDDDDER